MGEGQPAPRKLRADESLSSLNLLALNTYPMGQHSHRTPILVGTSHQALNLTCAHTSSTAGHWLVGAGLLNILIPILQRPKFRLAGVGAEGRHSFKLTLEE